MTGNPSLLISDLELNCSEAELTQWIEAKGYDVAGVVLIRDLESGTSPSFAHVRLKNPQMLNHAVRLLDGQFIHGRAIHVSSIEARSRPQQVEKNKGGKNPS